MADLLLQARKAPGLHLAESKSSTRTETKPEKLSSQPGGGRTIRKAVSRTLKDANNALLSWKDGLTVEERERVLLLDQRKAILADHMKTVCHPSCYQPTVRY